MWLLWLIPCIIVGIVILTTYISWVLVSYSNFPHQIKPGGKYVIDDRTYTVPHLPHKVYNSNQVADIERPIPMLDKDTLRQLRHLISDTFDTLDEANVEFWATGGTLISAVLWKSLMCYDDDCDIAAKWEDREYLWSPEFAKLLSLRGLETFYLRGASLKYATREMAAVRIRRKNTTVPTLDLFFVQEREDGTWAKVNTWNNGHTTHNPAEVWESKDWIYPLQRINVDGMSWPVPNQATRMLDKQYGPEWNKFIKSPKPLTNSHLWAFWISNGAGAWRTGEISAEDDKQRLVKRETKVRFNLQTYNSSSPQSAVDPSQLKGILRKSDAHLPPSQMIDVSTIQSQ